MMYQITVSNNKKSRHLLRLLKALVEISLFFWVVYSLYVATFGSIEQHFDNTNKAINEFKVQCIERSGRVRHDDGSLFCSEKDGNEKVFSRRDNSSDIGLWSRFLVQVSFGLYEPNAFEQ